MSVELPRDAEGREIPLDTVVMFGGNGNAYNIVRWSYITELNTGDENANSWYAVTKGRTVLDPELMYLTPPDSWEKLEEDLDRCIKEDCLCPYNPSEECSRCVLPIETENHCNSIALKEIKERIRKLRGED